MLGENVDTAHRVLRYMRSEETGGGGRIPLRLCPIIRKTRIRIMLLFVFNHLGQIVLQVVDF